VLQATAAKPTVKLHLAEIRMLFDWLVIRQVLATTPAHAVRGPKHVVRRGNTPVLTEEQARRLLVAVEGQDPIAEDRQDAADGLIHVVVAIVAETAGEDHVGRLQRGPGEIAGVQGVVLCPGDW
jgi:site-specific recombinase XerC